MGKWLVRELLDEAVDEVLGNVWFQVKDPEHYCVQLKVVLLGRARVLEVDQNFVKFAKLFGVFRINLYIERSFYNLGFERLEQ